MAQELCPLLFFTPRPEADAAAVALDLLGGGSADVVPIDAVSILNIVRNTRGFARLRIALPNFSFDNPRIEAALEGTAHATHIAVSFFGNFEKLAEPLYKSLTSAGLVCYVVSDKSILREWPRFEVPFTDGGFGSRMMRVLNRKALELQSTELDEKRRSRMLDVFVKSLEFRAEMAREGRLEPGRGKKSYHDLVNCFLVWRNGKASAKEIAAARQLDASLAAMSLTQLAVIVNQGPRLLLATAVTPREADELRRAAESLGLSLVCELP